MNLIVQKGLDMGSLTARKRIPLAIVSRYTLRLLTNIKLRVRTHKRQKEAYRAMVHLAIARRHLHTIIQIPPDT